MCSSECHIYWRLSRGRFKNRPAHEARGRKGEKLNSFLTADGERLLASQTLDPVHGHLMYNIMLVIRFYHLYFQRLRHLLRLLARLLPMSM